VCIYTLLCSFIQLLPMIFKYRYTKNSDERDSVLESDSESIFLGLGCKGLGVRLKPSGLGLGLGALYG